MNVASDIRHDELLTPIAEALLPLSESLAKTKRLCAVIKRLIAIGASVFLAGYAIVWSALLVLSIQNGLQTNTVVALISLLATGTCGGIGAFLGYRIFDDLVRNDAVFTAGQVKRLRAIALVFVLLFVIELAIPSNGLIMAYGGVGDVGIVDDALSYAGAPKINLSSLLFAAVFYCAAAIFEYASLLQQASDETI